MMHAHDLPQEIWFFIFSLGNDTYRKLIRLVCTTWRNILPRSYCRGEKEAVTTQAAREGWKEVFLFAMQSGAMITPEAICYCFKQDWKDVVDKIFREHRLIYADKVLQGLGELGLDVPLNGFVRAGSPIDSSVLIAITKAGHSHMSSFLTQHLNVTSFKEGFNIEKLLETAFIYGHLSLLEIFEDFDFVDVDFSFSIYNSTKACVKYLLDHVSDPECEFTEGLFLYGDQETCEYALQNGLLPTETELIHLLCEGKYEVFDLMNSLGKSIDTPPINIIAAIIQSNNVPRLEKALLQYPQPSEELAFQAGKSGAQHIIQYLLYQYPELLESIGEAALKGSQVDTVLWLIRRYGYQLRPEHLLNSIYWYTPKYNQLLNLIPDEVFRQVSELWILGIIEVGRRRCLEYLLSRGIPLRTNYLYRVINGHWRNSELIWLIKLLRKEKGASFSITLGVISNVLTFRKAKVFFYLLELAPEVDVTSLDPVGKFVEARLYRKLYLLRRYLMSGRVKFQPRVEPMAILAGDNRFPQLIWLRNNGYPLDETVIARAAEAGNTRMLDWLVKQGCPWDYSAYLHAIMNLNLHFIHSLYQRRPEPFDCVSCPHSGSQSASIIFLHQGKKYQCPIEDRMRYLPDKITRYRENFAQDSVLDPQAEPIRYRLVANDAWDRVALTRLLENLEHH
jgi:hypothetical protein